MRVSVVRESVQGMSDQCRCDAISEFISQRGRGLLTCTCVTPSLTVGVREVQVSPLTLDLNKLSWRLLRGVYTEHSECARNDGNSCFRC